MDCHRASGLRSNFVLPTVCDVWHIDSCIRVYKRGFANPQLAMLDGGQSTCAPEQDDGSEIAISANFLVLQGYMAKCKKHAAKETCVRSAALGVFLFRCIFSDKTRLVSSCEELAHWAKFEMQSEDKVYDLLAHYMQHKTPKSLWDKTAASLYHSMNEKITCMQLNIEFGIDHVIQSKIQQYKLIWKMPHVVRKTK